MDLRDEKIYYNALAIGLRGDYQKIKKQREATGSWRQAFDHARLKIDPEAAWKKLAAKDVQLVLADEPGFPALLTEIPWQPFALYIKGSLPTKETHIAIVGTRKATPLGLDLAKKFAQSLGMHELTIVSGLAIGVDAAAHTGALLAKTKTIAVLANGLDEVYPKQNEKLADEIIASGGTLVSEYPLGTPSIPRFFLERNRLVSGLSKGVLIIEAPERSGTLATARFATEQNRDVFVIPGSVNHINYAGSHALIKNGAALVTTPDDILHALGIATEKSASQTKRIQTGKLDKNQEIILNVLTQAGEPMHIDAIVETTKLEHHILHAALALLAVEGVITEENGNYSIL